MMEDFYFHVYVSEYGNIVKKEIDASDFAVNEGHLYFSRGGFIIAAFAPGYWVGIARQRGAFPREAQA